MLKNSANPLVSVIIPVYNGEKYLSEALDSVLTQTYQPIEIIVVDDGSTDGSRDIALSYSEVDYIYQTNAGTAAARNRGIQDAKGDYLAFLDADDIWMQNKLFQQMAVFQADPTLDIVSGHVKQFISPEMDTQTTKNIRCPSYPQPGYSSVAILIRRVTFDKIGKFHENYQVGETISWFANARDKDINIFILPDVIVRRRIHGGNKSIINRDEKNKNIVRILKSSLDRRRAVSNDNEE